MRELSPVRLPMVVKPRQWSIETAFNGCYLTNEKNPVPFIKRCHPHQMGRLLAENPVHVFEAVNKAQETPVRIRQRVLEFLNTVRENNIEFPGLKVGSLPQMADLEVTDGMNYGRKLLIKEENRQRANIRLNFDANLAVANEFASFERFYIPHHLDTRGRLYPIPTLNLQGADYVKGLLEFAEGKPLGPNGGFWLKVHTAGLFGVDKVSYEDRVAWVDGHLSELLASAVDPIKSRFWTTADKPIQAYAACRELLGFIMEGEAFISRMPIALDGSCSGLQHLGAAFRCQTTAKAVNLTPGDVPNDIYQDVADKVQSALEASPSELARQWLTFCDGVISRKITKRSVMTFPYGSRQSGFADQILEDTLKPAHKDGIEVPFADDREAAQFLANIIFDAVSATVLKAAEAMEWMKKASGAVCAGNQVINWTTPIGFPVVQDYRQIKKRKIDTVVFGSRLRSCYNEETDDIDARKMSSSIAPNVVHSLDASHLMLTVLNASDEGINSFALIHDSFGTHAADTDRFFEIIRESFIEQYEDDVFALLKEEFSAQVDPDEARKKRKHIPALPAKGDYDLNLISHSLFAFA